MQVLPTENAAWMKSTPAQASLFDLPESRELRDFGIETAINNERAQWMRDALAVIRSLPVGWKGIGEDIRILVLNSGLPPPHHPNVWGGLVMSARRTGFIERTPEWRNMKAKASHARTSPVVQRI